MECFRVLITFQVQGAREEQRPCDPWSSISPPSENFFSGFDLIDTLHSLQECGHIQCHRKNNHRHRLPKLRTTRYGRWTTGARPSATDSRNLDIRAEKCSPSLVFSYDFYSVTSRLCAEKQISKGEAACRPAASTSCCYRQIACYGGEGEGEGNARKSES